VNPFLVLDQRLDSDPMPATATTVRLPATSAYVACIGKFLMRTVGVHAEIKGDAIILHNKLASSTALKAAVDALPVPFAQQIAGATSFLNLLQKAQIKEYVLTNDADYTGHYDVASGKITESPRQTHCRIVLLEG